MTDTNYAKENSKAWPFLILLCILVLINIPLLTNLVIPQHDTMYMFQAFYFFYNDFFFNADIARWIPFGFYGVQSDYFLITMLSPSAYFIGLIGWLLGVKNVLLLFNISLLLSQFIYLSGTWLLCKRLFKHEATVFFVCLTVLCSTVLYYQFNQNFRIYSFLPLIIYLFFEGLLRPRTVYIAGALIAFLLSLFGNSAYFFPVMVLPLVIIIPVVFLEVLPDRRRSHTVPEDIRSGALVFLVFVIMAAVYYNFTINALDKTRGVFIGRDPVTMATDLNTFLTYAGYTIGFKKFTGLFIPWPPFVISGITLHVGLITLFFVLYALMFVRRPLFWAISGVVLLFVLFSLGRATPVAELLYNYFPTMKYYRHIGHSVANLKLFLPLMAGYGMEHLLDHTGIRTLYSAGQKTQPVRLGEKAIPVFEALLALLVAAGTFVYTKVVMPHAALYTISLTVLFLAALYLATRPLGAYKRLCTFVIVSTLFQMLSYQGLVNYIFHLRSKATGPLQKNAIMVNRYGFQKKRTFFPTTQHSRAALPLVERASVRYTLAYSFLQWDPCVSAYRTDFLNTGVAELIGLKGGRLTPLGDMMAGMRITLPYDVHFLRSIGCNAPKLKIFKEAVFADDLKESAEIIKRTQDMEGLLVLNGVPEKDRPSVTGGNEADDEGKGRRGAVSGSYIEVKGFTANELRIRATVRDPGGAWLYYADAWHPGWKAYVDKRPMPVLRANIAFKAIRLKEGTNNVKFVFDNRRSRILWTVLMLFELTAVCVIFAYTGVMLLRNR